MKLFRLILSSILLLLLCSGCFLLPERKIWEDDTQAVEAARKGLMIPGEQLTYTIKTGAFKLGEAFLSVKVAEKNVENLELTFFATSTHPWLPSLSYTYKSIVNKDDFSTISFQMEETRKSEIRKSASFKANYAAGKAEFTLTKKKKATEGVLALPGKTYDYISLIYLLRKKLPAVGESTYIPIYNEKEILNLRVRNLAIRELTLSQVGKFKGFILKPKREFEGVFFQKGNILLWMDETYNIPLRIIIQLPFGTGVIDLEKAENTQTGDVFIQ